MVEYFIDVIFLVLLLFVLNSKNKVYRELKLLRIENEELKKQLKNVCKND